MHQRLVLTQHMRRRRDGAQVQGFAGVPGPSRLRLPGRKDVRRRPLASKPLSQHHETSVTVSMTSSPSPWDAESSYSLVLTSYSIQCQQRCAQLSWHIAMLLQPG